MNGVKRMRCWASAARGHPVMTDVLLSVALCAATLVATTFDPRQRGGSLSFPVVIAVAAATGALLLRRRWPLGALAATAMAAAGYMMLVGTHGWVVTAPLIAAYHLAATTSDRRRLVMSGCLTVLVMAVIPALTGTISWLRAESLAVAAACGLAFAAGDGARNRRAYVAEIEERAHRAEHDREAEARRRVTEERLRIARDLHDSIGHHIALINAQAGMAAHVFDAQPAAARQALTHIRQAGRGALHDLQETIGLLRQPGEPAATAPTGGVAHIADVVASLQASGMQIDYVVDGPPQPLPPAADLTVYRVVQEALTNVRKHAKRPYVRLRLHFLPSALHVTVENTDAANADLGMQPECDPAGHGIVGMRERVTALGGRLEAGPLPGSGFRVHAQLPHADVGRA